MSCHHKFYLFLFPAVTSAVQLAFFKKKKILNSLSLCTENMVTVEIRMNLSIDYNPLYSFCSCFMFSVVNSSKSVSTLEMAVMTYQAMYQSANSIIRYLLKEALETFLIVVLVHSRKLTNMLI